MITFSCIHMMDVCAVLKHSLMLWGDARDEILAIKKRIQKQTY